MDYREMYVLLFNSVTDALKSMEQQNFGFSRFTLEEAQRKAEALYIESGEE
jgi:hypothetical protein